MTQVQVELTGKRPGTLWPENLGAVKLGRYSGGDFFRAVAQGDEKALKAMGCPFVKYDASYTIPDRPGYKHWHTMPGGKRVLVEGPQSVKVLGDQSGAEGGFFVPGELRRGLLQTMTAASIVRPRALIMPMKSRSLDVPGLNYEGKGGDGETALTGGMVPKWGETGTEKPETEPEFSQIELVAHSLHGVVPVKNAILADSSDTLGVILPALAGISLASVEDAAYIVGTGAGQPLGVANAPATILVPRTEAGSITYADCQAMAGSLIPASHPFAVWVASIACYEALTGMKDPSGGLAWHPSGEQGIPELLTFPVIWTEDLPNLGEPGDLMLCDFTKYWVGLRQDVTVSASPHPLFLSNRTLYRFSLRTDGAPGLSAPIAGKHGGWYSPFVMLGGRPT